MADSSGVTRSGGIDVWPESIAQYRRRVLLAAAGGAAIGAGCAGDSAETPTLTRTATGTATETGTDTETETATEAATDTPTETPADFDTADLSMGRKRNRRLFAVPSTGPTIDGSLDDWDLSGMIETRDDGTGNRVGITVMYDDDAVYIGGRIQDPTPMKNRHDPEVDPDLAWSGDSVQFRMVLDPEAGHPVPSEISDSNKLINLLFWYFTDDEQPNLQVNYGLDLENPYGRDKGLVPHDDFEAGYQTYETDDETGYTFEYRIPWETLHAEEAGGPPSAGDLVGAAYQVNFGDQSGLDYKSFARDLQSSGGFPYQSVAPWGKLLFSEKGDLPASVVEAQTTIQKPLPFDLEYDLPTDGEVSIALYDDQNRRVRQIVASESRRAGTVTEQWDGLDAFERPLPAGDYTWKGLVHEPLEIEHVVSVHNSGNPPWNTSDGTGSWGANHGTPTDAAAAGDDVLLTWDVTEGIAGILRATADGQKQWGIGKAAAHVVADDEGERFFATGDHLNTYQRRFGAQVFDASSGRSLNYDNGQQGSVLPEAPESEEVDNTATGLAYADGRVYVSLGHRDLVAVNDADSGELLETHAVPSPERLAASADRALVVSGETGNVHDLTMEREGGAPPAVVDTQIKDPRGIALDDRGRIFVANGGDRQNVTVHDADGGLVREIGARGGRPRIGRFDPDGMLEPGGITIDADEQLWVAETLNAPKRHSVWDTRTGELVDEYFGGTSYSGPVWMDPEHPDEVYCDDTLWKVDLDTGEKRPHSTVYRKTEENAPPGGHGFKNPMRVFTANNGRQYAWGGSNRMTTLFERDGDVFRPLMGWLGLNEERAKRFGLDETGQYVWRDTNGDGLMQADEFEPLPEPAANRSSVVGPDLSLYTGGKRYRPTEITDGVPAYDYESPEELTFGGLGGGGLYPIHPTGDAHYTWFADRTLDEPDETPGFAKRTLDGDLQWGFTRTAAWKASLEAGAPKPGEFHAVTHLLGEAGGFTGTQHYMGNSNIVTTDGIAVGDIYRTDSERGFDRRFTEAFFGQLVQPTGMDRYFHLGGDADGRIVEVHGLDTVQRLDGGTYTVTEEDAALAQRAYEQYRQNLNASQSLTIVRGDRGLESASGVSVSVDENRSFTAKLAYDDRNLYVQYRVESPAPLTNAVSDPKFLFEGGNCIDIQLATGDADPDREEPAPGDVRLLITRRDGSPFAMLYEPDVEGFSGDPVVFESPVDEESFDRISQVDGVELAYETTADGFTATATVPLSAIGFSPEPASTVRGDVGYVFGDTEGRGASARAYWANNGFEANVVDDVPDESRLNPEHWGSIVVE